METLLKSVNTKLQMLEFTNESVREALEKRHVPTMERKLKTLQDEIDEIQDLETKIQEAKIEKGENIEDIKEWSSKIESDISKYEASVLQLNS
ncbi:Pro-Pol poly, partial [Paramuricea clavata]